MSYTPINWDENTPITATNLDIMDSGIANNEDDLRTIQGEETEVDGRITINENDISSLETEQSNQDSRISTNEDDIDALSSAEVVDEGSTSDGDYIRYENGWQICAIEAEAEASDDNDEKLQYSWNYPQSFSSNPAITMSFDRSNTDASLGNTLGLSSAYSQNSTTSVLLQITEGEESGPFKEEDTGNVSGIAIGRWK